MNKEDKLIDDFINLVKISSPSLKEEQVAEYLIEELRKIDIIPRIDEAHKVINGSIGNIIVEIKGNKKGRVLFSAHMDTVSPCENVTPVIEGDVIKSNGKTILGGDDKAGIAVILGALREVKKMKGEHPDVVVVFSIAEEIGIHGAKNLDMKALENIDYAFILDGEGSPGIAYNKSPYSAKGTIKITGKEAHAGINPEDGINAFVVAAYAVSNLKIGRVDEETTCNIGKVNGGIATNVVMPSLEILFECRSLDENKLDDVINSTKEEFLNSCNIFGATLDFDIKKGTPGFYISEDKKVMRLFKNCCENTGVKYKAKPCGGASDTNIYIKNGIESLNIAVGMEAVHTKNEYIKKRDIFKSLELVMNLIENV